jgi:hypothetical protein
VGAERWDEQVGSVADEATRLLESLRRSAADAAASPPEDEDGPDAAVPAPGLPGAGGPDGGMPGAGPAAAAGAADGSADAPHDPFCDWCPLCRGAAVVRSLSPETLARLADLASFAATVLTDLAGSRSTGPPDSASSARPDPGDGPPAAPSAPARARRSTPTRPIPVSDADDPQEAPRG